MSLSGMPDYALPDQEEMQEYTSVQWALVVMFAFVLVSCLLVVFLVFLCTVCQKRVSRSLSLPTCSGQGLPGGSASAPALFQVLVGWSSGFGRRGTGPGDGVHPTGQPCAKAEAAPGAPGYRNSLGVPGCPTSGGAAEGLTGRSASQDPVAVRPGGCLLLLACLVKSFGFNVPRRRRSHWCSTQDGHPIVHWLERGTARSPPTPYNLAGRPETSLGTALASLRPGGSGAAEPQRQHAAGLHPVGAACVSLGVPLRPLRAAADCIGQASAQFRVASRSLRSKSGALGPPSRSSVRTAPECFRAACGFPGSLGSMTSEHLALSDPHGLESDQSLARSDLPPVHPSQRIQTFSRRSPTLFQQRLASSKLPRTSH